MDLVDELLPLGSWLAVRRPESLLMDLVLDALLRVGHLDHRLFGWVVVVGHGFVDFGRRVHCGDSDHEPFHGEKLVDGRSKIKSAAVDCKLAFDGVAVVDLHFHHHQSWFERRHDGL